MTGDVRTQLQQALGTAYTLDRELGWHLHDEARCDGSWNRQRCADPADFETIRAVVRYFTFSMRSISALFVGALESSGSMSPRAESLWPIPR